MWLLEQITYDSLQAAIKAGVVPTVEQQAQYTATHISALTDGGSRIMAIAGNTAEISVKGVLTKSPDIMSMLFGGGNTTYTDIISAINEAEQNDEITDVVFAIDSPGGNVDGLFETISAMEHMKKRKRAVISGVAASAAYAIASHAGLLSATNKATRVGSIGILAQFSTSGDMVTITSTDAPRKAPDVTTPEGVAMVREELDALHEIFIESIAAGRGIDVEKVNKSFGRGSVLLSGEALKRGMIDSISEIPLQSVKNTITRAAIDGGANLKVKSMDLSTLQAEHPATYAAAVAVGVESGTETERDRVAQHIIMGEASGDMKTALVACKDGSIMTGALQATYMSAGMARHDIDARIADDADAGAAGDNVNTESDNPKGEAEKQAIDVAKNVAAMVGLSGVSL